MQNLSKFCWILSKICGNFAGIHRILPVFAVYKNPTPVAAWPCRQRAVCSTFRIPPVVLLELASSAAQSAAALRDPSRRSRRRPQIACFHYKLKSNPVQAALLATQALAWNRGFCRNAKIKVKGNIIFGIIL